MVDFDTFSFAFWTLLSGTVADSNPRNAKKVNVVVIVIAPVSYTHLTLPTKA